MVKHTWADNNISNPVNIVSRRHRHRNATFRIDDILTFPKESYCMKLPTRKNKSILLFQFKANHLGCFNNVF